MNECVNEDKDIYWFADKYRLQNCRPQTAYARLDIDQETEVARAVDPTWLCGEVGGTVGSGGVGKSTVGGCPQCPP